MDTLQAIKTRRSIAKVSNEPVERELIEQIIEAGCWAPNHKRTEPFRFTVFEDDGLHQLDAAWQAAVVREYATEPAHEQQRRAEKVAGKAMRAPVVVAVWLAAGRADRNPPLWEEEAAVSACIQNMLLAAHALGVAAIWRSGNVGEYPEIQALLKAPDTVFDAEKGDRVMGFVYMGYADPFAARPTREQPNWQQKTFFYSSR